MNATLNFGNAISWLFGLIVFALGIVNCFWGNDPGFGVFLLLLSFVYFPPVSSLVRQKTGYSINIILKVLLAIFIIWAALGVGELFDKIELMRMDF